MFPFNLSKPGNFPLPFMGIHRGRSGKVRYVTTLGQGGRLVLHKRKPVRDPQVAINMAFIRARGPFAPGNRGN